MAIPGNVTSEMKSAMRILSDQVGVIRATFGAAAADDDIMLAALLGMAVPELKDQVPAFMETRAASGLAPATAPDHEAERLTTPPEPTAAGSSRLGRIGKVIGIVAICAGAAGMIRGITELASAAGPSIAIQHAQRNNVSTESRPRAGYDGQRIVETFDNRGPARLFGETLLVSKSRGGTFQGGVDRNGY